MSPSIPRAERRPCPSTAELLVHGEPVGVTLRCSASWPHLLPHHHRIEWEEPGAPVDAALLDPEEDFDVEVEPLDPEAAHDARAAVRSVGADELIERLVGSTRASLEAALDREAEWATSDERDHAHPHDAEGRCEP